MTRALVASILVSGWLATTAHAGAPLPAQPADVPWPTEAWPEASLPENVDAGSVEGALDRLFTPKGRGGLPDTRAVLVAHRGRIVSERYADGFGPGNRFHSWSMAKSVTQALVAILVREGRFRLDDSVAVEPWSDPSDPRRAITLRQLLNMTSGLDNGDGGDGDDSFIGRLFFGDLRRDTAHAGADVTLLHPPGTHWAYSSATGSILASLIASQVGGELSDMLDFMQRELFAPLGIRSLVPEFDRSGTFLGGGFVWASARDWARLGTLFLRDGIWDGRRILPEGWVEFTRTPAPAANNGTHSAHFWVTGTPAEGQFSVLRPELDAFMMTGNSGQMVIMVPDRDLVAVRLGELQQMSWGEIHSMLSDLIEAFPPLAGAAP